jgi:hypothetical protein
MTSPLRALPLLAVLSGCVMTPRLGYTELRVEQPIFEDAVSRTPVAFRLDPRIQDVFVAKSDQGIKDVEVTEFRKTLLAGARSAFPQVQIVEAIPTQGLGVTLVDVRPSAVKVAAITQGSGLAAYTNYEVRCSVAYGVSIHRDGTTTNVTGQVTSRDSASLAAEMGAVCASGLAAMYAEIRAKVVADLPQARGTAPAKPSDI